MPNIGDIPKLGNLDQHALHFDLNWLLNCRVKILIVTDSGSGGFGEAAGFHLGQVLKILDTDPWPHVTFEVSKAHRQNAAGADVIDNFRFDGHDLSQYDQIWLFGINRTGPDPLSPAELNAVAQFMDQGGGMFATGDHENLGQAMAAEVPRVRSMRRWYYPDPGPNDEPPAPAQTGGGRHDTIVDTDPATAGLQGSQSDAVPQTIRVRSYQRPCPRADFLPRQDLSPPCAVWAERGRQLPAGPHA